MHQLSIAWAEFLVLNNGFKNATVSLETPCCAAFVHERTCDSVVATAVDPGVGCILECPSTSPTRAAAVSSSLDVTAFRVNHAQPGKAFLAMYQKRARISRGLQQCCDVGFTRNVILKPSRGAVHDIHSLDPWMKNYARFCQSNSLQEKLRWAKPQGCCCFWCCSGRLYVVLSIVRLLTEHDKHGFNVKPSIRI